MTLAALHAQGRCRRFTPARRSSATSQQRPPPPQPSRPAPLSPLGSGIWTPPLSAPASRVQDKPACLVAGTWSINQALSEGARVSREVLMSKPYVVEGLWMAIEASATSATNLEWFVEQVRQTELHPLACVTSGAA